MALFKDKRFGLGARGGVATANLQDSDARVVRYSFQAVGGNASVQFKDGSGNVGSAVSLTAGASATTGPAASLLATDELTMEVTFTGQTGVVQSYVDVTVESVTEKEIADEPWTDLAATDSVGVDSGLYVQPINGGVETVNTIASSGTATAIDLGDGNVVDLTLDDDCTLSFTGATASAACSLTIFVRQDGTGSHTLTLPASVKTAAGDGVTITTTASAYDMLVLITIDEGSTWTLVVSGQDFQ